MRPHFQRFIVGLSIIFVISLPVAAGAQGTLPQAPVKPAAVTLSNAPLVDSEDYFENEYLRVYLNKQGQFIITALEGTTKSEVPLLYPNLIYDPMAWSSFATVRYRYLDTPSDSRNRGQWHKFHTTQSASVEHRYLDKSGDRGLIVYALPLAEETKDAEGTELSNPLPMCGMFMKQSISFMTNPYTGRQDMVRIRYSFEHGTAYSLRNCNTENNRLDNVEFGLRVLLDTQVGDADTARVLLPESGASVPGFVRLFESNDLTSDSRQAMIDLTSAHAAAQRAGGPQVSVIAGEWGKFYYDQWDSYPGADTYGDSGVAIRWDGMVDPWTEVFELGYGLAPAGGGESWIDAPAALHDTNTMRAYAFASNQSQTTRTNGVARLTLPPGMTVPIASAAATADGGTWQMPLDDLVTGHTVHAAWDVAVTGPAGRYVYTTTTRFDGQPLSIVTSAVELKQSFGFSQLHTIVPEGNPTTGVGGHSVDVEVRRYNPNGDATVAFALADDAGNFNAATAGSDYVTAVKEMTFEGDEITKTVSITIIDDSQAEPNESILLTLSKPSANAIILDQGKALLTIADNDEPLYTNFLNLPALARQ
mgnify:CR=1 FL=1